jgi:hypothetical protein
VIRILLSLRFTPTYLHWDSMEEWILIPEHLISGVGPVSLGLVSYFFCRGLSALCISGFSESCIYAMQRKLHTILQTHRRVTLREGYTGRYTRRLDASPQFMVMVIFLI